MFKPTQKIIHRFKYTRKAYFNNGTLPLVEELVMDSEVGLPSFKKNVEEWHRKGQLMKEIPSKSHVQGYDYWITEEQAQHNATVTHEVKTEMVYVHD